MNAVRLILIDMFISRGLAFSVGAISLKYTC
jgi:hypothetical protein